MGGARGKAAGHYKYKKKKKGLSAVERKWIQEFAQQFGHFNFYFLCPSGGFGLMVKLEDRGSLKTIL